MQQRNHKLASLPSTKGHPLLHYWIIGLLDVCRFAPPMPQALSCYRFAIKREERDSTNYEVS